MAEDKIEEETYSLIFTSLKHPIRRRILRMLADTPMTFSEILESLTIDSGHLNYHLESLGDLVLHPKDGKYLLVQRSLDKKAFPGKWTVPGGGLETDDYINFPKDEAGQWYKAIEKSLRREIKEETNLEVGRLNYLIDIAFIRPDGIPVIVLSYFADYKSGEVKLDEDNTNYAWVTLEQAKTYDMIGGILGEIEMVDKIKKGIDPKEVEYRSKINK